MVWNRTVHFEGGKENDSDWRKPHSYHAKCGFWLWPDAEFPIVVLPGRQIITG